VLDPVDIFLSFEDSHEACSGPVCVSLSSGRRLSAGESAGLVVSVGSVELDTVSIPIPAEEVPGLTDLMLRPAGCNERKPIQGSDAFSWGFCKAASHSCEVDGKAFCCCDRGHEPDADGSCQPCVDPCEGQAEPSFAARSRGAAVDCVKPTDSAVAGPQAAALVSGAALLHVLAAL